ncbi:MAG: tetratricopeptide repeat protein, partial [bacterium]
IFFAMAFMAKPTVITFPILAILLEYTTTGRVRWRNIELPLWICLIGIMITLYVQSMGGAIRSADVVPIAFRLLNAIASIGIYVRQSLLPADLAVLYPLARPIAWQHLLSGTLACLGLAAVFWRCGLSRAARTRGPTGFAAPKYDSLFPYAAGIGWFIIGLAPMLGFVQVGNQAYADRYTYWPSIGLSLALAWGIARIMRNRPRSVDAALTVAGGAVILTLATCALRQVSYWRNTDTLFTRAIQVTSWPRLAHHNLGIDLCLHGRLPEGIWHLRQAMSYPVNQGFQKSQIEADLAVCLTLHDEVDEARQIAIRLNEANPRDMNAKLVFAMLARRCHNIPEAERRFRELLRERPTFAIAWWELGAAYADRNRWPEALAAWRRALALQPDLEPVAKLLRDHAQRAAEQTPVDWRMLLVLERFAP